MSGVSASPLSTISSPLQSKYLIAHAPVFVNLRSNLNTSSRFFCHEFTRNLRISCNSSSKPGASGSAENDSRNILDAFFLGKALGEALTERIESTVGEFLSTVGRFQAEQQKQVQDFQEEVYERAKQAKEKAAREAMKEQGLAYKSTTANKTDGVILPAANSDLPSSTTFSPSNAANTEPNPGFGNHEGPVGASNDN